jgi:hypothetical protein
LFRNGEDKRVTARIDTFVKATAPSTTTTAALLASGAGHGGRGQGQSGKDRSAASPEERERRARERERIAKERRERELRWAAITEAGGTEPWIAKQLRDKGLSTEGLDTGGEIAERDKAQYKIKKKAEADERRRLRRQAWEAYQASHIGYLGAGVHWEDGERADSGDRFDVEHRSERARDNGLPELKGAADVAKALGLSISRLRFLTYHREADSGTNYYSFTIPKRDGSPRTIRAPKPDLKAAQRWVLRNVAERLPVHSAAHGFLPERSILTNAAAHAGAEVIVKLDIREFFPTVTWKRVKGLLRKSGLPESAATLLSLLTTEPPREAVSFRGKTLHVAVGPRALPQGAPTSPALTNALCLRMDRRLSGLGRTLGFRYTRYADDLTFSWRPEGRSAGRAPVGALLRGAAQILTAEGFELHREKTQVLKQGGRQKITGLVVNAPPKGPEGANVPPARVPREVLRRLRAAIHNRKKGKPGREGETLDQLKGMAAFVHMTDPVRGRALLDQVDQLEQLAASSSGGGRGSGGTGTPGAGGSDAREPR